MRFSGALAEKLLRLTGMFKVCVSVSGGFETLVVKWAAFERIGKGFKSVILLAMSGPVGFAASEEKNVLASSRRMGNFFPEDN